MFGFDFANPIKASYHEGKLTFLGWKAQIFMIPTYSITQTQCHYALQCSSCFMCKSSLHTKQF